MSPSLLSKFTVIPGVRLAGFAALAVSLVTIGNVAASDARSDLTPTLIIAQAASTTKLDPRFMSQAEFEKLDCKSRWRMYRQSQECFSALRRTSSSRDALHPPDASTKCGTSFQDPSCQCKIEPLP